MLGEKIGEEHGKVTTRRALKSGDPRYLKLEVTIETEVSLYGTTGMNLGTYEIMERIPGQLYADGQGIIMTADGEGVIWSGFGIGRANPDGSLAIAASISFQTSGKLERLNGVVGLVEHTAGSDGSASSVLYEWKA
jgi:hypothetical protein